MAKDNQKARPKINNYNPYNKLNLNKFHQIDAKVHSSDSKLLHKKKRDIERVIRHKQEMNEQVDEAKLAQLEEIKEKLENNHKQHEKNMRKEFFIKNKYKKIMNIEMRKISKKIRSLKEMESNQAIRLEIAQMERKQRYIKFFPKNLKYVSLFPSNKPLEEGAIEFQNKVMDDIEKKHRRSMEKRNAYVSENKPKSNKKIKSEKVDDFFIEEKEQENDQE